MQHFTVTTEPKTLRVNKVSETDISISIGEAFEKSSFASVKDLFNSIEAKPINISGPNSLMELYTYLNRATISIASSAKRGTSSILIVHTDTLLGEMIGKQFPIVRNNDVPNNEIWVTYWNNVGVIDGGFYVLNDEVYALDGKLPSLTYKDYCARLVLE